MAVGWSPKIKLCNCEQVSALHGFSSQDTDSTLNNQNYVNLKKDQDHRLSENPHRFNLLLSLFLLLSDPITLFHGSEIFYGLLNVMKILNRISLLKRHGEIWQEPVYKSFACPLCDKFFTRNDIMSPHVKRVLKSSTILLFLCWSCPKLWPT